MTLPATVADGDVLLMFVGAGRATPTGPAGWTQLGVTEVSNNVEGAVYYLDADGTEGGTTVTVGTSSSSGEITAYVAAVAGGDVTSLVVTSADNGGTFSGNLDVPGVTTTAGDWLLFVMGANDRATTTWVTPTGWTEQAQVQSSGGTAFRETSQQTSTKTRSGAGTEPDANVNDGGSNRNIVGFMVGVPEAAGGATPIAPDSATHGQTADVAALTGVIAPASADHDHTADVATVAEVVPDQIAPDSTSHTQTADVATVSPTTITPDSTSHAHTADVATLVDPATGIRLVGTLNTTRSLVGTISTAALVGTLNDSRDLVGSLP